MPTVFSRHPKALRPLSLKNIDNKLICSTINFSLRRSVSKYADPIQRGFVSGRQLVSNVLDLDSHARLLSFRALPGDDPALVFWDIANAFPFRLSFLAL